MLTHDMARLGDCRASHIAKQSMCACMDFCSELYCCNGIGALQHLSALMTAHVTRHDFGLALVTHVTTTQLRKHSRCALLADAVAREHFELMYTSLTHLSLGRHIYD